MLPPHPELRLTDLTKRPSTPSLSALVDGAGVRRFYNARAAIYHLARALRADGRDRMLLPAFHCPSVVEPVLRAGMRPVFYRIDRKLQLDLDDVRRRLDGGVAAALFINFLGFPSGFEPLLPELRARGILAVEDCAHAAVSIDPLELAGRRADAAIYSFWKLVPSGVGGGLWLSPQAQLTLPPLERAPLKSSVVRAKHLAEEVITGLGEDSLVARAYGLAERGRVRAKRWLARPSASATQPSAASDAELISAVQAKEYFFSERLAHSRLPWMSERIMSRVDLAAIVRARRDNYQTLAARLDPPALIRNALPALPPRISPLAYPVLVPDRSSHDLRLREREVPVWTFGSTLHRVLFETAGADVLDDAVQLRDTLLLVSVHHLLRTEDMDGYAKTMNDYCAEIATCARS
jgi:hypothetical protein